MIDAKANIITAILIVMAILIIVLLLSLFGFSGLFDSSELIYKIRGILS